ncbi:uncharacterized protein LOC127858055 [Dreissena polymorpha]|uniref:Uncharacterized protein n=1 Tax=Dreissena polymorpha TaxID=45954 RepID=A0A9D4NDD6_DREPO|nr:uncharacterized protein LOC127858055 [Dreissena polymorpha]KAH3892581.1 hypothetical protein DPMN_016701 [Dreissena polymorpha]
MTKADLDKDIRNLKQERDNLYGSAKREQENRKDHTFKFGHSMGGIGFILDLFGNIFTHIFGGNDNYYQEIMKQYSEADESLRRTMEGQEDIIDQILDMRAKALSSLENLKKMARQQDGLGDITHLREVDRYLGNVDKEFTKILTYWENMAATIKYLRDDIVDSSTFVDVISEPDGETQFREDLIRTEKNWKFFGKICSAYIEESDKEVFTLYRFLSKPIDNKSAEAIRKRQDDIIAQIENDINSALPSMDD